ncbi:MAG: LCP family protein [Oscillospiraceae bacterium]|nr:LCP family protein [Oscillospiraceae bacterium]
MEKILDKVKDFFTKPARKSVRRRSNWYIYLISFASTLAFLLLIVLAFQDLLFSHTPNGYNDGWGPQNYTPEKELDVSILFMMGESQGAPPDKYMLVNYRPKDGAIVLVPLNPHTRLTGTDGNGKITDLYASGGAKSVVAGIEKTLGIKCRFVQFERSSFTSFAFTLGKFYVNAIVDFDWESNGERLVITKGEHALTGSDLFSYIIYATFPPEHDGYDLTMSGEIVKSLVNTNLKGMDVEAIYGAFMKIVNNANTDLTSADYRTYQQALYYTSQSAGNPAHYYLPSGEYDGEEFVLSNQTIADILKEFNLLG